MCARPECDRSKFPSEKRFFLSMFRQSHFILTRPKEPIGNLKFFLRIVKSMRIVSPKALSSSFFIRILKFNFLLFVISPSIVRTSCAFYPSPRFPQSSLFLPPPWVVLRRKTRSNGLLSQVIPAVGHTERKSNKPDIRMLHKKEEKTATYKSNTTHPSTTHPFIKPTHSPPPPAPTRQHTRDEMKMGWLGNILPGVLRFGSNLCQICILCPDLKQAGPRWSLHRTRTTTTKSSTWVGRTSWPLTNPSLLPRLGPGLILLHNYGNTICAGSACSPFFKFEPLPKYQNARLHIFILIFF